MCCCFLSDICCLRFKSTPPSSHRFGRSGPVKSIVVLVLDGCSKSKPGGTRLNATLRAFQCRTSLKVIHQVTGLVKLRVILYEGGKWHTLTLFIFKVSWPVSRYEGIRICAWHENPDEWFLNVADGSCRPNPQEGISACIFLSASDSGSSGVADAASGNFTSCKDKKERKRRETGGRMGECGLQLEDITSTSHPRWKRNRQGRKRRNKKIRDNLQISSDVIY